MKRMPQTFSDQTFTYTQLARHDMLALYCQEHKASGTQRFEVVRLHVQAAHTWPNGVTTPEREAYPPSSAWGRAGWSYFQRGAAEAHLRALVTAEEAEQPPPKKATHTPAWPSE